jgi:hypothetical protein
MRAASPVGGRLSTDSGRTLSSTSVRPVILCVLTPGRCPFPWPCLAGDPDEERIHGLPGRVLAVEEFGPLG